MIRELLDMPSLLNGCLRLQVAPLDLRHAVEDAVAIARPCAQAGSIDLQRGDADRLRQVAWSLLSNAVKSTPARGGVRVSGASHPGPAEVAVAPGGARQGGAA